MARDTVSKPTKKVYVFQRIQERKIMAVCEEDARAYLEQDGDDPESWELWDVHDAGSAW